ncbi:hypothetical protein QBC44DRAFT_21747 [Cladorrhinum sp. PSN332]|nr:hypothetical protein QBC44DRAFT_21747 [Cladorrhinum sp. PSN332]
MLHFVLTFLLLALGVQATARGHPQHAEHANLKRHVSQLQSSGYDFIIVGGGTSGLTVADRLSAALPHKSVLVVEYGDVLNTRSNFDPPSNWLEENQGPFGPMWVYKSLPNTEFDNKTAAIPAGQVLGGCSAINSQIFDRGDKNDYDAWTEVGGSEFEKASIKWNWKGIFPSFKKSTTFTPPESTFARKYGYTWDTAAYGNGPIQASYPPFQWADVGVKVEAFKEMGFKLAKECAGGYKHSVCWIPSSQHPITAARSHSGNAHYTNVIRPNYHLLVRHQGVKVIYPRGIKNGPPAVQVRSTTDNTLTNITAKAEVIISSGALNTPLVLQRSGIGPASFLRKAGIPVLLDLPGVGSNLQDHNGPTVWWNYSKPYPPSYFPLTHDIKLNATFKAEAVSQFSQLPARGPYTMALGNTAAYISLPKLSPSAWKKIISKIRQSVSDSSYVSYLAPDQRGEKTIAAGYKYQLLTLANLLSNPEAASLEAFSQTSYALGPTMGNMCCAPDYIISIILHPLSRGTIRLNMSSPLEDPVMDYRAGTHPVDFDIHMAHVRFLRKILDTPTYKALGGVEGGPGEAVARDDGKLKQFVKDHVSADFSFAHPCCTASMLPESRGGVVGVDLKVHRAAGLRVVDMSVTPLLVGSHTSSTAYAVGEKAAGLIIDEWRKK